jgi:putative endonuclease
MPYMYILECNDGTYYTGSTYDLEKRIFQHNDGTGANYTSKRIPVKLVYFEKIDNIDKAFKREKQIQRWSHAKKKALIEKNWDRLHELAKCLNETAHLGSSPRLRSVNRFI